MFTWQQGRAASDKVSVFQPTNTLVAPGPPLAYRAGVDSSNLKPEQSARLRVIVKRDLRFLAGLCVRCQQFGWPVDDPVWQAARSSRDANGATLQSLNDASQVKVA